MGRTLSGASYDRNDYVLQPHNGGSGCASVEELKERYGMIRENEFNTPGGVLAYDEKGNVPVASLPSQILTRPSTYIKGPVTIVPGGTATYKISNYNESTNYNVSFNGGTILITDDTITITAGTTAGVYELVINNEKYELAIATSLPRDVNIATHALLTTDLSKVILSIKTSATIDNGASHFATDYQVATDEDFENVVFFEQMSPNKTEARFVLNKQTQYFIRARVIDTYKQKSAWSNVTNYDIKNIGPTIGTPSAEVRLYKDDTNISVVIEPSSFYSETGQELNYAEVKVYSDSTLTTEVASGQWTDITKPYTFKFTGTAENLYTVFRHVSKSGVSSYWSKELYKKSSELFSTLPVVRRAHFLPDPSVDGTLGYISRQSYMSPNGNWAIVADGINPSAFIYKKIDQGQWILDSVLTNSNLAIDNDNRGFICTINNTGTEVILASTNTTNTAKAVMVVAKRINNTWSKVQTIDTSGYVLGTLGAELDISNDGNYLFASSNRVSSSPFIGKGHFFKRNVNGLFDGPYFIENPGGGHIDDAFGDFGVFNESSNRLVISAWNETGSMNNEGAIYIFNLINNVWTFETKITPSTIGMSVNYAGLNFGYFIRTKNDRIAIGTRGYRVSGATGAAHGAVIILRKNNQSWELEATLISGEGAVPNNAFGYNFDINEKADRAIIGSSPSGSSIYGTTTPPSVSLYERTGTTWTLKHIYRGINPGSIFGRAVNISADGRDVLICARKEAVNSNASNTGSVAFYSTQEKKYEKTSNFTYTTSQYSGRMYGAGLTVSDDGLLAAFSNREDKAIEGSNSPGIIQVVRKVNGIWTLEYTIQADGGTTPVTAARGTGYYMKFNSSGTRLYASRAWKGVKGAVSVFSKVGSDWNIIENIDCPDAGTARNQHFGFIFTFDKTETWLAISKQNSVNMCQGIYIYKKENGLWVLKYEEGGNDLGVNFTGLGRGLVMNDDGTKIIASEPYFNSNKGQFTQYSRTGDVWTKTGSFNSVAGYTSPGNVLISSRNLEYIYSANSSGNRGVEVYKLKGSSYELIQNLYDSDKAFGYSMTVSEDGSILYISNYNVSGQFGHIVVYNLKNGSYVLVDRIYSSDIDNLVGYGNKIATNKNGYPLLVGDVSTVEEGNFGKGIIVE